MARWLGVEKALDLSIAQGRTFEEGLSGQVITRKLLDAALSKDVNAISSILDSGNTVLSFEPLKISESDPKYGEVTAEFSRKKQRLINILNSHESSYTSEAALKNKVTHGIRKVALNLKNQLNLFSPISMDTQQAAADRSELGKDEANISIDIPSSKYMMQEQNMVGKQCIGITAVAIKCFFAKSGYYNNILDQIPNMSTASAIAALNSLTFENPISGKLSILANVNLKDVIVRVGDEDPIIAENVPEKFSAYTYTDVAGNTRFRLKTLLRYLQRVSNRVDCALELSGLLSAATDNAKALILSKINATAKFIDIYTVGLQCGSTFDEIAEIMTSPIFNAISRLADSNIFKTYQGSYSLEKAINFYLGEAILPGVKQWTLIDLYKKAFSIDSKIRVEINDVLSSLKDNKNVRTLLENQIYGRLNSFTTSRDEHVVLDEQYNKDGILCTKGDLMAIADFLEECEDRNVTLHSLSERKYDRGQKNYQQQIADIVKIRDKFIPATKEQQILGNMLKINQGLPSGSFDQYSLVQRIENFVSERTHEVFDLMRFINDVIYKEEMIEKYEKAKSFINILDVIDSVPHFAEMFRTLSDNNRILTKLSARYELSQDIAKEVNPGFTLSELEFKQVGNYINDMFLVSYLTGLNKTFVIPEGIQYYKNGDQSGVTTIKRTPVTIENLYDLASFKSWVENYVIPTLKSSTNPKFRNNFFLASLSRSFTEDRTTGKDRSYYKLPLNMMTIDSSAESKAMYQSILTAFDDISKDSFEGWKLGDIFFVYNAIVNKDGFGQTSMTRIFEDLIDTGTSTNLVSDYYEYIAKIDDNAEARKQFKKALNVKDIRFYINSRVRGSYVRSELVWDAGYDFTFTMPSLLGNWTANKPDVKDITDNISTHAYKVTSAEVLESVVSELKGKYGEENVQMLSAREIARRFPDRTLEDERAFILDGVVYINKDRASIGTVMHEFTHLVLAGLKFDEKRAQLYYKLVNSIKTHPDYELLAEPYRKLGLVGSDLDEEVFGKALENYFDNKIAQNWNGNQELESSRSSFIEALNDIFGTNITSDTSLESVMSSSPAVIFRVFGSGLINPDLNFEVSDIATRWRLATQDLKYAMINSGEVSAKCD